MTLYLDDDFKLHTTTVDGYMQIETSAFDGKCTEYIEGFRFVPQGESWMREDGTAFHGPMCVPWKSYAELEQVQRQYEREQIADMQAALEILGVTVDE